MADPAQTDQSRRRNPGRPRGRPVEPADRAVIVDLLGAEPPRRDRLIEYLHAVQDSRGCLPIPLLAALAEALQLSQAEVYEVASFYHHFELVADSPTAPLRATIRVCTTGACQLLGGADLVARMRETLGNAVVVEAPCIGRCDSAPAALVDGLPLGRVTLERAEAAIAQTLALPEDDLAPIAYDAYRAGGGYRILEDCVAGRRDAAAVIAALEQAGLRGLGGAGFPVARKWRTVAAQPAPRLMAVNLDEGEPGTFKDRWYLERDPHRFLEGMLIAAWAVGVDAIYVYVRDEYADGRRLLADALADLDRLPLSRPPIEIRRGAGAYICGEESAMIESIEGKRGMPRLRPPYVAEVGLFGRPTLEQNFETLYWLPAIVADGGEHFSRQGRRGRHGLRSFSVSGRVRHPGVKLAPAGISLRELVEEYCGGMADGQRLYAYMPGGASGGILPAALADLPLDFDTLQPYGCFIGSAAIIVLSEADSVRAVACRMMDFFAAESCGQCTPCREGTVHAAALMRAGRWDEPLLRDLARTMADASICGLGQAAPNPMLSVLRHFRHEAGLQE